MQWLLKHTASSGPLLSSRYICNKPSYGTIMVSAFHPPRQPHCHYHRSSPFPLKLSGSALKHQVILFSFMLIRTVLLHSLRPGKQSRHLEALKRFQEGIVQLPVGLFHG